MLPGVSEIFSFSLPFKIQIFSLHCSLFSLSPVPKCTPPSPPSLHSLSAFSASFLTSPLFPASYPFHPSVFKPFSCPVYPRMLTGIFLNILNLLWLKLLQYFHSQITQKCSVIVLLSAILIAPPLSGPVSDSKTLLQEMSGAICTWHGLGLV